MIAECAICLLRDTPKALGGIWTPGAAMGTRLIKWLVDNSAILTQARCQGTRNEAVAKCAMTVPDTASRHIQNVTLAGSVARAAAARPNAKLLHSPKQ
jgi:hypothetical protein